MEAPPPDPFVIARSVSKFQKNVNYCLRIFAFKFVCRSRFLNKRVKLNVGGIRFLTFVKLLSPLMTFEMDFA